MERLTNHATADAPTTPAAGWGLALEGVRKVFADGNVVAVERMDLRIAAGEFVSILGPSGCGKSTLLRLIAGLEKPTEGRVTIQRPPTEEGHVDRRSEMAYVFQDAHLLPWRTVLRNVELPLELMGVPRAQRRAAALDAIGQVGLFEATSSYPAQLSGGMRMRVSLARALVTDPKLLLLDEPFAALDEMTRQRLDEQLYGLWRQRGMTVLFVTHSTQEATFLSQRAIVLSRRPARILLDRSIALPLDRTASVRGEPAFAREMHALFGAMED